MPNKVPSEFQRDVVAVVRRAGTARAEVTAAFDIAKSMLKRRLTQADVDDGIKNGLTTAEQNDLAQLHGRMRRLEIEDQILPRASAYFAAETLPK